jgi:hypothetical protein
MTIARRSFSTKFAFKKKLKDQKRSVEKSPNRVPRLMITQIRFANVQ